MLCSRPGETHTSLRMYKNDPSFKSMIEKLEEINYVESNQQTFKNNPYQFNNCPAWVSPFFAINCV